MDKRIKSIINKYEKVYNGAPWYGDSITKILKNVNPGIVFNKVDKKSHSIAELVAHMIGWRDIVFNQINGNKKDRITQKETFNWKRFDKNEKTAWESLLIELDKNQMKYISFLGKKDDEFLNAKIPGKSRNAEYLIEGIIQHDVYHLGQMALLNKILKPKITLPY